MLPVSIELEDLETWFKDESIQVFVKFLAVLATHLDWVDEEVDRLSKADFGESVTERMIRDTKAAAFERIEKAIIEQLVRI